MFDRYTFPLFGHSLFPSYSYPSQPDYSKIFMMTHEIFKDPIWSKPSTSKPTTSARPTFSKLKTTRISLSSEEDEPIPQKAKATTKERKRNQEYPLPVWHSPKKIEMFSEPTSISKSYLEPSESSDRLSETEMSSMSLKKRRIP